MNFIKNYSPKYEAKGFEDKHDYFMDRMTSSKGKGQIYEVEAQQFIIQHLISDRSYPKNTLKQDYSLFQSRYRADIVIIENSNIQAVIEVKRNKNGLSSAAQQLEKYYSSIIQNQTIHPKLFVISYSEGYKKFYEYNIKSKDIGHAIDFPYYKDLIANHSNHDNSIKTNWDNYIKNIDLAKLSNVKRGIEDDNFKEAIKVREFLKNYDKQLRKKIPFLNNFNSKPNSHPNQPQWTPENGFRYSYYINDNYLDGIQLNITIWANWKGGVFIKDNENIIFSDKKLLEKLIKKYSSLEFRETHKDIFAISFDNGIVNEERLLKGINTLIDLLKDVNEEKDIFKKVTKHTNSQNFDEETYIENNGLTVASQNNDNPKGEDSLDIASDVNALSKLIAYKQLEPPLSIGLFGDWGSGKSFFMHEIHKKVDTLSASSNNVFCKNIVHIEFNAWHYSDSNLWASLVSKIFNTLNDKIKSNDNKNSLFEKLQFSQDRLKEIENEQEKIDKKIDETKKQLEDLEQESVDKTIEIKNITITSISQLVFKNSDIKSEISSLKNELEEVGIINESDINSLTDLVSDISTIQGTARRFINVFATDKYFLYWIIGSLIFALIIAFGTSHYFEKQYFIQIIAPLLAVTLPILKKLHPFIKKVKDFSPKINKFLDNYELKKQELLKENNKQKITKQNEIEKLKSNIDQLQFELSSSAKVKEALENEISDIKSGKYLADFISKRSDDYNTRLGLISIIRDDFEKLSSYLKDKTGEVKIDRIILYIDDLDRCTNDLVIDVLEAIHLLLAFDLFVVVVGVDVRWISNSLNVKYENLDISDNQTEKATPLEYLEKIFQIPFHLNEITDESKKIFIENLLSHNIENIVEEEITQQNTDKVITPNNEKETLPDSKKEEPLDKGENNNTEQNLEHQHLEVSIDELNYIKDLSSLISSTPRNIKRFINIYMIIRSHEKIHNYHDKKHYQAIIFLLTVVFANPKLLLSLNNQESLTNLVNDMDLSKISNNETINLIKNLEFPIVEKHLKFLLRFSFRT